MTLVAWPVAGLIRISSPVETVSVELFQANRAPSDGPNMIPIKQLEPLLQSLMQFDALAKTLKS